MNTATNTLLLDTLFLTNYTDETTQNFLNSILKIVLAKILQQVTTNSRVAHRTRINIFDLIRVLQNMNITPLELFKYLNWIHNNQRQRAQRHSLIQKQKQIQKDAEMEYYQECKVNLSFGTGFDPKRPGSGTGTGTGTGTDFFPPLPTSYTYSFTPLYGQREDDVISLLKRHTQEKLLVEQNLFNSFTKHRGGEGENFNLLCINYDDI